MAGEEYSRGSGFRKIVLPPGSVLKLLREEDALPEFVEVPATDLLRGKRRGFYVALEGIDGSGKTTIAGLLREMLVSRGIKCIIVREPWTPEAKKLLAESRDLNPLVEAYLFAADRLVLHARVISKELEKGTLIIGDRSFIASLAYQVVRGVPEEIVESINAFALKPNIIFLLDLPVEEALERIKSKNSKQLEHLEKKELLEKIRERYLLLAQTRKDLNIQVVNATKDPTSIAKEILKRIMEKLGK